MSWLILWNICLASLPRVAYRDGGSATARPRSSAVTRATRPEAGIGRAVFSGALGVRQWRPLVGGAWAWPARNRGAGRKIWIGSRFTGTSAGCRPGVADAGPTPSRRPGESVKSLHLDLSHRAASTVREWWWCGGGLVLPLIPGSGGRQSAPGHPVTLAGSYRGSRSHPPPPPPRASGIQAPPPPPPLPSTRTRRPGPG